MNEGLFLQNNEMSIHQSQSIVGNNNPRKIRIKPKYFKLLGQIMNEHVDV
jgi:hypothetical protein